MSRLLPILTGTLTTAIFGFLAFLFFSEQRYWIGSVFLVLTLYRAIMLIRQAWFQLRSEEEEDEDEDEEDSTGEPVQGERTSESNEP